MTFIYEIKDGRPVPLSQGQRRRKETQERLCVCILKFEIKEEYAWSKECNLFQQEVIEGLNYIDRGKFNLEMNAKSLIDKATESASRKLKAKNFNKTKF